MNLIVPMAGMGKRLRPHTLTTPKPLVPIAGKPIVQRLVEDIAAVTPDKIEKIGFVIGEFGKEIEASLLKIAEEVGAEGYIFKQKEALGTAHAVHCAKDLLDGRVIVAFADTLFKASFTLNTEDDGIIWVKQVEDPSAFGVVTLDESGIINQFVEKPTTPVSDLAIIGIYYFKSGESLKGELQKIIDENIMAGGEYQLTTALENLKQAGVKFTAGKVEEWLDCGNKAVTVESNSRYLGFLKQSHIPASVKLENSIVIDPVFIGENTVVKDSIIGPGVSLGSNCQINDSIIKESLIQNNNRIFGANMTNSMIGNYVTMQSGPKEVSLGDYIEMKE